MVSSSPISINLFFFLLILGPCLGLLPDFSIVGYSDEDLSSSDRLLDLFESWVAKHGKSYAGFAEKLRRFKVFKDNLRHIDAANREGNYSYWLGLNEFADLTHEEFKVKYLGVRADAPSGRRSSASSFSGYMAPEYAMDGLFSAKYDVFSFGIVLLEIISGASNGRAHGERHGQSLLGHAWDLWNKDKATELIDPLLENQYSLAEAMKCISLGLLCVQKDAEVRPTMYAVVLVLQSDHIVLPQPSSPPKY